MFNPLLCEPLYEKLYGSKPRYPSEDSNTLGFDPKTIEEITRSSAITERLIAVPARQGAFVFP